MENGNSINLKNKFKIMYDIFEIHKISKSLKKEPKENNSETFHQTIEQKNIHTQKMINFFLYEDMLKKKINKEILQKLLYVFCYNLDYVISRIKFENNGLDDFKNLFNYMKIDHESEKTVDIGKSFDDIIKELKISKVLIKTCIDLDNKSINSNFLIGPDFFDYFSIILRLQLYLIYVNIPIYSKEQKEFKKINDNIKLEAHNNQNNNIYSDSDFGF